LSIIDGFVAPFRADYELTQLDPEVGIKKMTALTGLGYEAITSSTFSHLVPWGEPYLNMPVAELAPRWLVRGSIEDSPRLLQEKVDQGMLVGPYVEQTDSGRRRSVGIALWRLKKH